jgi:hypothetical protein
MTLALAHSADLIFDRMPRMANMVFAPNGPFDWTRRSTLFILGDRWWRRAR